MNDTMSRTTTQSEKILAEKILAKKRTEKNRAGEFFGLRILRKISRTALAGAPVCVLLTLASPAGAQDVSAPAQDAAEIDWSVLAIDAATLATIETRNKPLTTLSNPQANRLQWQRTENPDGTAAVIAKRNLSLPWDAPWNAPWDAKVGMDLSLPKTSSAPSSLPAPDRLIAGTSSGQASGTAWARVNAPALNLPLGWDKASVEARIDPVQEQSKLGTRLNKSVPLSEQISLMMESGLSVTNLHAPAHDIGALTGISTSNIVDAEQIAKLKFDATGTSIGAGSRKSSTDDVWLKSLNAEQKLTGGLSVNGALSETVTGEANTSVNATFRRNW